MDAKLIYDVGLHSGGDARYYLWQGFRVVSVDAEAKFIEQARREFAAEIAAGSLRLVHAAIDKNDGGTVAFYVSTKDDWSSTDPRIAERKQDSAQVLVSSRTLAGLFAEHGTPVYCKIDIEGADAVALESLQGVADLPEFISCESECSGRQRCDETQSLHTLRLLLNLGYSRFKLVDQESLAVLPEKGNFYRRGIVDRLVGKLRGVSAETHRNELARRHGFRFEGDVSGPWGDDLAGVWLDFAAAEAMYVRHRRDYFSRKDAVEFGFWVDWHATR